MRRDGFPAYTTSTGWLGYPDEKVRRLCREAMAQGFTHFKMKVSAGPRGQPAPRRADARRDRPRAAAQHGREPVLGRGRGDRAGEGARRASTRGGSRSRRAPTTCSATRRSRRRSRPIKVATGEMCQNRVIFKQLLQAGALGYCQVDSCRVGGVNEVLAILLLAAKFGVPVCPHAGGVGLCEYVQHLAIYDYIALNPSIADRYCEYVDHLHEHFVEPVRVVGARYQAPLAPGYSIEMKEASLAAHEYPGGRGLELLSREEAMTPIATCRALSSGRSALLHCSCPGVRRGRLRARCSTASPPPAGCSAAARRVYAVEDGALVGRTRARREEQLPVPAEGLRRLRARVRGARRPEAQLRRPDPLGVAARLPGRRRARLPGGDRRVGARLQRRDLRRAAARLADEHGRRPGRAQGLQASASGTTTAWRRTATGCARG